MEQSLFNNNNYGYEISEITGISISNGNWSVDYPINPSVPKPKKVIYSNPATIVFWEDGTKTVVKAMEEDEFDPERGYLQAFYEKASGMSRTQCNKQLRAFRAQYNNKNLKSVLKFIDGSLNSAIKTTTN